ncbi:hypothetical protein BBJ28_00009872 [Nothophytophthora sp. Chile5]|nr:hypothetical protein BBJ28_00009872 [Nothophytophthora sp. Chile5]
MGEGHTNALALESASRRELQFLAKELQLCRGNAKSDVILSHALQFLSDNPSDGEQRVLAALAALTGGARSTTLVTSPVDKTTSSRKVKVVNGEQAEAKLTSEESPAADQSEDEQSVSVDEVEMSEQHAHEQEKAAALSKHNSPAKNKPVIVKKAIAAPPKTDELETPEEVKKPEATPSPPIKSHTSTAPAKTSKVASQASNSSDKAINNPRPALASLENVANKKVSMPAARKDVEALVDSLDDLSFVSESRVRCSTTGHEMKADRDTILAYTTGKRYLKARRLKCSFAQYAPMFVSHPDEANSDMLWCNVTESAIARDRKRVEAHIAGPKYQKELPLWRAAEAAKKKVEEEAAQRRAVRVEAAKKRRLAVATKESADVKNNERPAKRVAIDRSRE